MNWNQTTKKINRDNILKVLWNTYFFFIKYNSITYRRMVTKQLILAYKQILNSKPSI